MERLLKSRYKIAEKISENPFCVSYNGTYIGTDKPVIIKIYKRGTLNSSLIKSMKQKVKDFSLLTHHGIAKLIDGDYGWQGFYYVREFVEGKSLQEILHNERKIGEEKSLAIMAEICQTLEFIHSRGIIHGALKPSNIFITTQGVVKLADFVIEGEIKEALPQKPLLLMQDGQYVSPEELTGSPAAVSSDVFALGLILLELFKAQPSFCIPGLGGALKKLKHRDLAIQKENNSVPRYILDIAEKATQVNPALRFASVALLGQSLAQKAVVAQPVLHDEYIKIFDSTVARYDEEDITPEHETLEEIGQIKIHWGKEKHRNLILVFLLGLAVISGLMYAFMFGR